MRGIWRLSGPRSRRIQPSTRCAVFLLTLQVVLLARGASLHSPVFDEVGHLPAGISHWRSGRFDLYRVNPPLVRLVATWPAVLAGADIDWREYAPEPWERPEFRLGQLFIGAHAARSLWYFKICRWACLPFAVLGGWICFLWARQLHGAWSGIAALLLWVSSPDILAHGELITPDAGAAALGIAAGYTFWGWLHSPSVWRAVASGVVLGLALLTKFTLLVFFAAWPILWLSYRVRAHALSSGPADGPGLKAQGLHLSLVFLMALNVVNAGYGFEASFRRLGDFKFVSEALSGLGLDPYDERYYGNRFTGTWLERLPVPVPANYLQGIDVQYKDFEKGMKSYLRGVWRSEGWWYYYLYAALVKEPAGTLCLTALAFWTLAIRPVGTDFLREVPVLLPAAMIVALVSLHTGFNHHYRYILPALPYIFVTISRVFAGPPTASAKVRRLGSILLAWSVGVGLWYYPHSLAFFNEIVGGPLAGPRHLHYSNLDWGQDLLFLKRWCERHPEARPLQIVYSGSYDPMKLKFWGPGITSVLAPGDATHPNPGQAPAPRWYALGVGRIFDPPETPDTFARFRSRKPDALAGYTFYLFCEASDYSSTTQRRPSKIEGDSSGTSP